jgi:tol-pal system protein YbgF
VVKNRMHRTLARLALTLAIVSCTALPVGAQNREHQQMSAELRMLQEHTQQLALTLAQITEALKAINARMDAADLAAQKRFADQELLIKKLGTEVGAISERTQDTDTRLRKLADEVAALQSTLTSLPSLLSAAPPQPPTETSALDPNAPGLPVGQPSSTGGPPPSTIGLSPSRMLETARSDYFAGSYASAITSLEALLKTFPKTEAAAEAQILLGDTYSQQKRWQEAVSAYTAAIQNYPRSTQVPDAYYRRGKAQESLGQLDAARGSYEQLIKTYPETSSAGLARQAVERLGRSVAPARP